MFDQFLADWPPRVLPCIHALCQVSGVYWLDKNADMPRVHACAVLHGSQTSHFIQNAKTLYHYKPETLIKYALLIKFDIRSIKHIPFHRILSPCYQSHGKIVL